MLRYIVLSALTALVLCAHGAPVGATTLNVPPVQQATPAWCWLATGEMVFRYYGIPSNGAGPNASSSAYQCGEARGQGAVRVGPSGPLSFQGPCWMNCVPCAATGSRNLQGLYNLVVQYPQIVQITVGNTVLLKAQATTSPLSLSALQNEIDSGRPVFAGISPGVSYLPPGVSEHAVLIVGYQPGGQIIINDPFPYQQAGMTPAYVRYGGAQLMPGRFIVPYEALVGPINWANTIYGVGP
ncbi:Uncharacterised protein [Burkholderia pseudomallei]|uniref:C39 family peptidase n=2 Tax=Burkholderia pseudomallei TaxID=28450 RepID=UPI0005E74C38|nr:Uncharacterised protein [Burkholderia pseudomallei]CFB52712.1 Uncharacterised protein [Burkholderia pseudomallei]CFD93050.1 Uncharacterised protein [Burkholderia pseudomallei]CFK82728.1 Uncharacterised protein [Burkholderia pseudomallei]CFK91775.1 Uncharacterised protein [Burkholderia pseudomallei]